MQPILFLASADPDAALRFYRDTLEPTFIEDSPFALVFDAASITLRIQKVDAVTAVPYTVLGFEVDDIGARVRALTDRGVTFERFDFMEQGGMGVWETRDGARVAWFRDPDGNLLSLTQAPK